ncbi:cupin domain-containing protein [Calidifontibacter terrae]
MTTNAPIDLRTVSRELLATAASSSSGRHTQVLHAAPDKSLTQVMLALSSGRELSEHENPGQATLQVVSGKVRLVADKQEWTLDAGGYVTIPFTRHSLHALTDAVVILTIVHTQ